MPGAQVAESTYTPGSWQHEPVRLIVRPVPFSAQKIADGSMTARRRKTIHQERLALAPTGEVTSVFGYGFILTDIPRQSTSGSSASTAIAPRSRNASRTQSSAQALPRLPSGAVNVNRV